MSAKKPIRGEQIMFRYRDKDGQWHDMDGSPIAEPKGPEWNPCMIDKVGVRIFKFIMN